MPSAVILCLAIAVTDGDTFRCNREPVRIAGINTADKPGSRYCRTNPRAWCDAAMQAAGTKELRWFLAQGDVRISPVRCSRRHRMSYNRTCARVTVNGRDAGAHLLGMGLARRWR